MIILKVGITCSIACHSTRYMVGCGTSKHLYTCTSVSCVCVDLVVVYHILSLVSWLDVPCVCCYKALKMKLCREWGLGSVFEHCPNYVNTTNHIKYKILKYSTNRLVATFFLLTKSENAILVCDLRRYKCLICMILR